MAQNHQELIRALKYIGFVAVFIWWPLIWIITCDPNPLHLFTKLADWGAALMFICGACIASATSVGGGMIFNPTLQFVFQVSGYSALVLAVLVQCAGMASGSYGWYRKGYFSAVNSSDLLKLVGVTVTTCAITSWLFVANLDNLPTWVPTFMKITSMIISIYVAYLVWQDIRAKSSAQEAVTLKLDKRIWPWVLLGAFINVFTAVGAGMLVFSNLIRYYKAPAKVAVACGTLTQAVAVWTQSIFLLGGASHLVLVNLVCIGLLGCMMGGRLAPYLLHLPWLEPHVKPILAFTALIMGITSGVMLVI